LYDRKRSLNFNTVLIPHGVDAAHFETACDPKLEVAEEIANLPRPVIGFWGLIQDWVDVGLLARVARMRPDWSFVTIGEVRIDVSELRHCHNFHFLGRQPYVRRPSFARGFDVGMIPFVLNDLTRAVNPIKLQEYLRAGLPVVSTPLPEVRDQFGVFRGADAESFVSSCEAALNQVRGAGRRPMSNVDSWDDKVEQICEHLGNRARGIRRDFIQGGAI
jgi:glycosyltransferase involved in cell wall biosynthesis